MQLDPHLGSYQRSLDAGLLPVTHGHVLTSDDRARRTAILHLMCNLELPYDLPLEDGATVAERLAAELARFAPHREAGLVELKPDRISVTPTGRFFLRNLAMELDAHLPPAAGRARFSRTV